MQWKTLLGWVLVVIGGVGLLRLLPNFSIDSYSMGGLTTGILLVLFGVVLIRSARPGVRR